VFYVVLSVSTISSGRHPHCRGYIPQQLRHVESLHKFAIMTQFTDMVLVNK